MADPRFFAVKPCPPQYGSKRAATVGASTSSRNGFLGSLGKIGDLEILNNSNRGSKVGTGLRTLASISNSVRTGCGSLPSSVGGMVGSVLESVDTGGRWVLDQVGITQDQVDAVSQFSPAIANQAVGQAKQIFEQVQRGHFKVTDIPGVFQDLQNLERLSRNIFTPQSWFERNKFAPVCEASPYAVDLIQRAPKHKFLFVVQFKFNTAYGTFDQFANDMAFVVKKSTRPSIKYDMEDVNFYNFRSKFITKSSFDEMQMSFHDDGSEHNSATRFVTAYAQAMTPITNIGSEWSQMADAENMGMNFDGVAAIPNTTAQGQYTTASTGALQDNDKTVLSEIVLYQVFAGGRKVNIYHFFNPRVSQLTQDDVDMSVSTEGNEVQINFAYDSVYTELDIDVATISERLVNIQGGSGAVYKIRNVGDQATAATPPTAYSPDQTIPVPGASCSPANTTNTSLPPFTTVATNASNTLRNFLG